MINSIYSNMNVSPLRSIQGKVELYNGSTLPNTFLSTDKLQEIKVTRAGEKGKFFGFGICQQATVKIVDKEGNTAFSKGDKLTTSFGMDNTGVYVRVCPTFTIKEAKKDENTNTWTLTAYDVIYDAVGHTVNELALEPPYTIKEVVEGCAELLGLTVNITDPAFDTLYEEGANVNGDENIRTLLNAVAEATQTIYYIDHTDELKFKRLSNASNPIAVINKSNYFDLTTGLPTTLTDIMSVTELGDNVVVTQDATGATQYVRDNPFWNNRMDIADLLLDSINRVYGLTIVPYNLKWRGSFLTEICDKISLEAKDGSFINTFILDDSFTYSGGFNQISAWEYVPDSDRNTAANPATLGDKLNQTFARVDKANKQIELVASESAANKSNIAALQINTNSINASVEDFRRVTEESIDNINGEVSDLSTRVDAKMTSEQVAIEIQKELSNGVTKVNTSTGFTFDETGLTVSKSNSEITTQITEDGMTVYKNTTEMLTANNEGVRAVDLHATTYLIIGENSRLEDVGSNRTACFWIGG